MRNDCSTRVNCRNTLVTSSDQRLIAAETRNSLSLHVRAHQSTVSVVVLEERNQRGCNRDNLSRRNVNVVDLLSRNCWIRSTLENTTSTANLNSLFKEETIFVGLDVRRSDQNSIFLLSSKIDHLVGNVPFRNLSVRRHDEPELIHTSVRGELRDQTNVWTFRRFDWADSTVVRTVNVANFQLCTGSLKTTRSKRGKTSLVGNFRQRVRLIHKGRQLVRTKEALNRGRDRLDRENNSWQQVLLILRGHSLSSNLFHSNEAESQL